MNQKHITDGARGKIPVWLQNLIWFLAESGSLPDGDVSQVFQLTQVKDMQRVTHLQGQPPCHKVTEVPADTETVDETVLVIKEDNKITMLLASEYEGEF